MEVKKMKRTFLKVLPFAAALLLATSCSKDENNSSDEIVNNNEQTEIVKKTFKTLTVKGKVNKSISKVTVGEGYALAFEGTEKFTFGSSSEDVYGSIDFADNQGNYTATINYTDEEALFNGNFTATLGSNSTSAYADLATAVHNAYYTIDFTITQEGEVYKLKSGETDLVVNLESAFIQALCAKNTQLGGADFTVEKGKYYVVPVGQIMGETENTTVAGQIYTIKNNATAPTAKTLTFNGNQNNIDGSAQELITEGTTDGGEWQYKLGDDGEYSTDIPTATNAGEYTVYYKLVGGDDYEDIAEQSLTVNIAKANGFVVLSSYHSSQDKKWISRGELTEQVSVTKSHGGSLSWKFDIPGGGKSDPQVTRQGNTFTLQKENKEAYYQLYFIITCAETTNYKAAQAKYGLTYYSN